MPLEFESRFGHGIAATLKKYIYFYLSKRQNDEKREIFCLLVHCPKAHFSWGWAKLKPGTWNSFWISHMVAGTPLLEPSPAASECVHQEKAGLEMEAEVRLNSRYSSKGHRWLKWRLHLLHNVLQAYLLLEMKK